VGHSTGNGGRAASGAQASAPVFVAACSMRCVDSRRCEAVVVEEIQWGDGKRALTRACMLLLARRARKLSWKETAEVFRTSWEKDQIQYAKGTIPDQWYRRVMRRRID
jgi:hypothetical protein